MKFLLSFFLFFTTCNIINSQNIGEIINNVNVDSIIQNVRDLSGEDSVYVNGNKVLIENRVSNTNDLAADYIYERLTNYGLDIIEQNYNANGTNIIAIQEGDKYPDSIYIICAHYDGVTTYCADDNASGSAAVLEAARILSGICFDYTIKYAFWDEEEIGLIGSNYYAQQASANGDIILGVLNLDMIAWDDDGDMVIEIHTNSHTNSLALTDKLIEIINNHNLTLNTSIINPGTGASDHASFWNNNYGSVLMIEEYYGGDFNPYYHSPDDRIDKFNIPYFHEMSKLAIGATASLASLCSTTTALNEIPDISKLIKVYPNPSQDIVNVSFINILYEGQIIIFDVSGQMLQLKEFSENEEVILDISNLKSGFYFLSVDYKNQNHIFKLIKD